MGCFGSFGASVSLKMPSFEIGCFYIHNIFLSFWKLRPMVWEWSVPAGLCGQASSIAQTVSMVLSGAKVVDVYLSIGNIHSDVQHEHWNCVVLLALPSQKVWHPLIYCCQLLINLLVQLARNMWMIQNSVNSVGSYSINPSQPCSSLSRLEWLSLKFSAAPMVTSDVPCMV